LIDTYFIDPPMSRPDRVIFFGTPNVAVPSLIGLHEAGVAVDLVVTGVDKRRSRGSALSPSPVKHAAQDFGLEVVHDLDEVAAHVRSTADSVVGVVVAYGRILPMSLLELIPMVNLHFSLLPRWRGAAPVERALLSGDHETGVCLMRVREELDAGEVFDCRRLRIAEQDTVDTLRERLNQVGVPMLVGACRDGFGEPHPQNGEPTYARKMTSDDLRVRWESSLTVSRQVRVGGAHAMWDAKRIKIHECRIASDVVMPPGAQQGEAFAGGGNVYVACGDGVVELQTVQPEGRARMSAASWWNGIHTNASVQFER